jgi:plasmid stabilization system protein ParE
VIDPALLPEYEVSCPVRIIFYTVTTESVVIVRVLDGRRDIDAEFQR